MTVRHGFSALNRILGGVAFFAGVGELQQREIRCEANPARIAGEAEWPSSYHEADRRLRREAERRNALREASTAEISGEAEDQNQVRSGMARFRQRSGATRTVAKLRTENHELGTITTVGDPPLLISSLQAICHMPFADPKNQQIAHSLWFMLSEAVVADRDLLHKTLSPLLILSPQAICHSQIYDSVAASHMPFADL